MNQPGPLSELAALREATRAAAATAARGGCRSVLGSVVTGEESGADKPGLSKSGGGSCTAGVQAGGAQLALKKRCIDPASAPRASASSSAAQPPSSSSTAARTGGAWGSTATASSPSCAGKLSFCAASSAPSRLIRKERQVESAQAQSSTDLTAARSKARAASSAVSNRPSLCVCLPRCVEKRET